MSVDNPDDYHQHVPLLPLTTGHTSHGSSAATDPSRVPSPGTHAIAYRPTSPASATAVGRDQHHATLRDALHVL